MAALTPSRFRFARPSLAVFLLVIPGAGGCATARGLQPGTISAIIGKPLYAHGTWALEVVDLATGRTLLDDAGEKMFVPGSVLKVYSTGAALDALGGQARFETPVYRLGAVGHGVLTGKLVLVASGDSSFGLRVQ